MRVGYSLFRFCGLVLGLAFLADPQLLAQSDDQGNNAADGTQNTDAAPIRVTTLLHDDGSKTVTKADVSNHTSEVSTYDESDKLKQRIVYTLDPATQQPQEGKVYAPNGAYLYRATYKRDQTNQVQEEQDFSPAGKLIGRFVYSYDSHGHVSSIAAYDGDGNLVSRSGKDHSATSRKHR